MANLIASKIQTKIYEMTVSMGYLVNECIDIEKLYFSGPSSQLSALGANDPVTVATKLTKTEIGNGITLCQQLNNFFQNAAVTQADYLATIEPILYGNDPAPSPISVEVEAVGNRLYLLCQNVLELFKQVKEIYSLYWANEIGSIVGSLSPSTVFYGIDATASELISGITLAEQWKKMINNEAVTTSDYKAIIAKWQRMA